MNLIETRDASPKIIGLLFAKTPVGIRGSVMIVRHRLNCHANRSLVAPQNWTRHRRHHFRATRMITEGPQNLLVAPLSKAKFFAE